MTDNESLHLDKAGKETLLALLTFRSKTKAAQSLSIDRSTLYQRIERYKLDEIIKELPNKALQTLQLGSERAAEVLVDELDSRQNKMEAAKEVLDRVGLTKNVNQTNVQVNNTVILPSELINKYGTAPSTEDNNQL